MLVRWLTTIEGTCDGAPITAGTVADIGAASAREFIARGLAESAEPAPVRTEEAAPLRNAAARTKKPTPRKG